MKSVLFWRWPMALLMAVALLGTSWAATPGDALMRAIMSNDAHAVRQQLAAGVNPNAKNEQGAPALETNQRAACSARERGGLHVVAVTCERNERQARRSAPGASNSLHYPNCTNHERTRERVQPTGSAARCERGLAAAAAAAGVP